MIVHVLSDLIVVLALILTVAFAATAFLGMNEAAAWLAGALVLAGLARLGAIFAESMTPDY
jgi:hypothetical protein